MAPKKKVTAAKSADEVPQPVEAVRSAVTDAAPGPIQEAETASSAAVYAKLQAAASENPAALEAEHTDDFRSLLAVAEDVNASLLLRVRALEFVAKNIRHFTSDKVLKDTIQALVKVICGEDDTPQLLIAALNGFAGIGHVPAEKRPEYTTRDGADVIMQVMLDTDGFPEKVRDAAKNALDDLLMTSFKTVVSNLLHWVSNGRDADDEERLKKESNMAVTLLSTLVRSSKYKAMWTPEIQEHMMKLVRLILGTAPSSEFRSLARLCSQLPVVAEAGGAPLLDAFFSSSKLHSDRDLEALSLLSPFVGPTTEYPLTAHLQAAGLLSQLDASTERGVWHSRVVLLAARTSSASAVADITPVVVEMLMSVMGDGSALPPNLSVLEALLMALAAVARKAPEAAVQAVQGTTMDGAASALLTHLSPLAKELIFSVKKSVSRSSSTPKDAEALACVANVEKLLQLLADREIPSIPARESWVGQHPLPTIKRAHDAPLTATGTSGNKERRLQGSRGGKPPLGRQGEPRALAAARASR